MDVLIERETELAVLDEVVRSAASGQGAAVLIEGEAGIGKTRLLGLARARAEAAGLRVLYATADEIEARVPFAGARVLLGPRGARRGARRAGAAGGAGARRSAAGSERAGVAQRRGGACAVVADRRAGGRAAARALPRRRPVGRRADPPAVADGGAARRASCRSRSSSPRGRRQPVSRHAVLASRARVRARRAGAALRRRHRAARRGDARAAGVRWRSSRGRARRPAATRCTCASCSPTPLVTRSTRAARRRSSCASSPTGSSGSARPRPHWRAPSLCWAPTPTRRGRARSPGSSRPRRSRPRRSCAASACSTPRAYALHPPARRGRGARGDRTRSMRPRCMRARPRCSPTRVWTTSASPST